MNLHMCTNAWNCTSTNMYLHTLSRWKLPHVWLMAYVHVPFLVLELNGSYRRGPH